MGREVLGTMVCPECGHQGAQVKAQKNGKPYRYCPQCDAQYFARSDAAAAALLAKIGKAAPAPAAQNGGCGACGDACKSRGGSCRLKDESPKPAPAAKAKPAAKPAPAAAPAAAPDEAPAPAPAPAAKRSGLADALGFLGVK